MDFSIFDAFIGVGRQAGVEVAVYDYDKCIDVLMERDGMSIEDAIEWMEYNVVPAYVGKGTPIFMIFKENDCEECEDYEQ